MYEGNSDLHHLVSMSLKAHHAQWLKENMLQWLALLRYKTSSETKVREPYRILILLVEAEGPQYYAKETLLRPHLHDQVQDRSLMHQTFSGFMNANRNAPKL
jgi:hypothetical protein